MAMCAMIARSPDAPRGRMIASRRHRAMGDDVLDDARCLCRPDPLALPAADRHVADDDSHSTVPSVAGRADLDVLSASPSLTSPGASGDRRRPAAGTGQALRRGPTAAGSGRQGHRQGKGAPAGRARPQGMATGGPRRPKRPSEPQDYPPSPPAQPQAGILAPQPRSSPGPAHRRPGAGASRDVRAGAVLSAAQNVAQSAGLSVKISPQIGSSTSFYMDN
jgi:hypothetical protein